MRSKHRMFKPHHMIRIFLHRDSSETITVRHAPASRKQGGEGTHPQFRIIPSGYRISGARHHKQVVISCQFIQRLLRNHIAADIQAHVIQQRFLKYYRLSFCFICSSRFRFSNVVAIIPWFQYVDLLSSRRFHLRISHNGGGDIIHR